MVVTLIQTSMKQLIIKLFCCIAFITAPYIMPAQSINIPDPLSSFSESQLEHLKKEYGYSAILIARSEEVAHLLLDPYTSIKMGKLKVEYSNGLKSLKHSGKTEIELRKERHALKLHFYSQLISLIGEEKFAQRQHYIEYATERKYMREYGFSSDQVAAYSHDAFKATQTTEIKILELSPELAIMMGELVVSYKEERAHVQNSGRSPEDIKPMLNFLSESHEKNVRILIGEDKYHIWKKYIDDTPRRNYANKHELLLEQIAKYSIDAIKIANSNEVKHLSLSPIAALEMGEIKATYQKSMHEVSKGDPEYKSKQRALKEHYHSSVRQLLGAEKFIQWIEYQNRAIERKYTEQYGFTMEQFRKYQDMENRLAVTILRIRSSAIPKEEKSRRIKEVKEEKVENLRQYLPAEVFDKWHKAYLKSEDKKKTSTL